jgi:DHA2 family multidrug resistance protein
LYGLVTLLPLFYQELMGYTALAAGWAVSPRGIGAILAMPVIGILTTKIDNRWLIMTGFLLFAISSLRFGQATLEISQWSFIWVIIISGFGSGSVFVPLSTTTLSGLPNEEIGNAAGLYNLLRNIGGSIGIALVNTIVQRHSQLHRNELAHSIALTNPTLQGRLQGLQQFLMARGSSPAGAMDRAVALTGRALDRQALLWSYVDDFRYMALVCFLCVPLVFLLKKAVRKGGAVSPGH